MSPLRSRARLLPHGGAPPRARRGAWRSPVWMPVVVALALTGAGCGQDAGGGESRAPAPEGAVAAGTAEATEAGLEILRAGGNAVDAAVAVSLAQGVTEPAQSGLGGDAVFLVRPPGEDPVLVWVPVRTLEVGAADPAARAGAGGDTARTDADAEARARRFIRRDVGDAEYPSALAVLDYVFRTWGSGDVTWEEVVAPALRLAEEGHRMGRMAHRTLVQEYARVIADPGATELLLTESRAIPAEGVDVLRPGLASTLRRIAEEGPSAFYGGELGRELASAAAAAGVALGEADLAAPPEVRRSPAVSGRFRGALVWTAPEPFAGPALLRALELLDQAPRSVWRAPTPITAPWFAEAVTYALATEAPALGAWMAELPVLPVPVGDTAAGVPTSAPPTGDPGGSSGTPAGTNGRGGGVGLTPRPAGSPDPRADQTAAFAVMDGSGLAVSATQSLGGPFGIGIPAGTLGFFFARAGGEESAFVPGLGPDASPADTTGTAPAPGRTIRWVAPSLLLTDSTALALASPGGPRAVSATAQVIAHWMAGEPIQDALDQPRIHVGPAVAGRGWVYLEGMVAEPADSVLIHIPALWGDSLPQTLRARGFEPAGRDDGLLFDGTTPWFGGVNAAGRVPGGWIAAADRRWDGRGRILDGVRAAPSG